MCDLMFDCESVIRQIRAEDISNMAFLASHGVNRNRKIAQNKMHRYQFRMTMDRIATNYENMMIKHAESIMEVLGV